MTKGLITLLFFVGFFAGLASGLAWANALGFREVNDALGRVENALKAVSFAEEKPSPIVLELGSEITLKTSWQDCMKINLGEEILAELLSGGRAPSSVELEMAGFCAE